MKHLFESWRTFIRIDEGGNKSLKTRGVVLTPELVKKTVSVYEKVISDWNRWLETKEEKPVKALRPVGSVSYYEKDLEEKPGTVYGDIDYLVEIPMPIGAENDTDKRKLQNSQKRKYTQLLIDYLNSGDIAPELDVEETLNGNVMLLILEVEPGIFVQADTVVTFPDYSDWMSSRYTPERGIKGYATGHLYTSLGSFFPLTIGTEGVVARTQNGKLVTGKVRKNVEIQTISTNPRHFLIDIAKYFAGESLKIHPVLQDNAGVNPENVSIEELARGIKGLALTLEQSGVTNGKEMIQHVKNTYKQKLEGNAEDKKKMMTKKEEELRDRGYDEGYIRNFIKDEQNNLQKILNVNKVAYELFLKGIE